MDDDEVAMYVNYFMVDMTFFFLAWSYYFYLHGFYMLLRIIARR